MAFLVTVTRGQLVGVYTDSLWLVWRIAVVFSGLAFFLVFLERQIKMRTELETELRLKVRKAKGEPADGGDESRPQECRLNRAGTPRLDEIPHKV